MLFKLVSESKNIVKSKIILYEYWSKVIIKKLNWKNFNRYDRFNRQWKIYKKLKKIIMKLF